MVFLIHSIQGKPRIKLRSYQEKIINEVHASQSRRIVIYAPTGAGKTVIACRLIRDLLSQGLRILVLVDQVTLIDQTSEKLKAWNILHGFIKSGKPENSAPQIQVASTQTLSRRHKWKVQPFDVVILDECHTTAFSRAAKTLRSLMPNARHIGLTATPWRSAKHEGLGDVFDELIKAPLPSDLINMGFLVQPVYYQLAEVNLKGVKVKCGDYDLNRLAVVCNTPEQVKLAISEYQRLAFNRPAIFRCQY
ncbi:DEAD/DEAH box helicase family protein [Thermosynechococcaceae cyanobacterium BACA0444]|uniref:DEAD/DEAH box helicase family protein n=1 Tax=Pseudocalidococcus azoricus BACA0444 TaxID=2918990 RepID=A0AAE4FU18_9CYAN|nr:DEAD/DEAH box helicase family protein [Pseudocalidococcus azoricus]MDS3861242.1 DEAD/DEAH box helicase family protein [Pseudocalidococcus azoricus BACA0444]